VREFARFDSDVDALISAQVQQRRWDCILLGYSAGVSERLGIGMLCWISCLELRSKNPCQPRLAQIDDEGTIMNKRVITEDKARNLAALWVQAWNSHDLTEIMSHYAENVVLVSPVAARILNDPLGTVKGKDALRAYFEKALEVYPNLKFDLVDVMWGLSSVVLYYVNQNGTKTGEFMEIDSSGKVVRVVANYNT
jgi:ketosteroid isomerase-like protein